eukprot:3513963-Amphidinium_carterae.1
MLGVNLGLYLGLQRDWSHQEVDTEVEPSLPVGADWRLRGKSSEQFGSSGCLRLRGIVSFIVFGKAKWYAGGFPLVVSLCT